MAEILDFRAPARVPGKRPETAAREDASPEIADAAARARALDPVRSFIVEAPAGSGKTGLLVQRYLKLLADPSTDAPEEILAITFTRKATAELRERVLAQLQAAAGGAPLRDPSSAFELNTRALATAVLARDRQLGWKLPADPRRLRIQTIDALSVEIANTLPLLSGSAARRPVSDAEDLYRRAARNTLRGLGGEDRELDEALQAVLLHRDGNLLDVETLLAEMLAAREQWAGLVPLDRASLSEEFLDRHVRLRLERTLEGVVCSGLRRALDVISPAALAELAAFAHELSGNEGYGGSPSPIQLCRQHPGPPAAKAEHLEHWRALISLVFTATCGWRAGFNVKQLGFALAKEDRSRLQDFVQRLQCEPVRAALEAVRSLPPARYPDVQWQEAKALFRLLLHAMAELRLLFAKGGECDFSEFSLAARQALGPQGDAFHAASGTPLRHLLVDEMQDTSSAQYDLLVALTRTWDGSSQTLFLVGDPKQSIYLFRQARVERFLRTVRDRMFGDIPLEPLQLTANFRSRPALVQGVNRDFAELFPPPARAAVFEDADVPFVAATPSRASHPVSGVQWHTRVEPAEAAPPQGTPEVPASRPGLALAASAAYSGPLAPGEDALAIRRIVERWRATPLPRDREATATRPAQPWRIAVLAAARRHLAPIVAEFSRPEAPIPYRAVRVEALAERPEVMDAVALTRALHHPADRTAWFAVLRAPWCGLDAADLLRLAGEDDARLARWTVPQLVAERGSLLSQAGRRLLERAWPTLEAALQVSARFPLSQLVERTWYSLGSPALLQPEERANVERYMALLRDCETGARLDLRKLRRSLQHLYAEPAAAPDAVELMTVHGAKGLEWDVVLVPELGRRGQAEKPRLLNWLELELGTHPAVLLAPIQSKGQNRTTLYQWLDKVHSRRVEAERKRVFYVACTRAREELHLFATARHGKAGLSAPSGSLLHACWPAAAPHFENTAAGVADSAALSSSRKDRGDAPFAPQPGLAIAAAASAVDATAPADTPSRPYLPRLTRMPATFDPIRELQKAGSRRLPYTPASELPRQQALPRPEGSVAVRALGNVVHRFLEQLSVLLARGQRPADLTAGLPAWIDRLTASLRGEGLAPAEASREATRALSLLAHTLADPVGVWLLQPHSEAATERPLATASGLIRVDRSFLAGGTPLSQADDTLWIVDFKTTAPGGRSIDQFLAAQRTAYSSQLSRYAAALRALPSGSPAQVRLGLYFPAIPRLLHWDADSSPDAD